GRRNRIAAWRVPRQERFAILQRHRRDSALPGTFSRSDYVNVAWIQTEIRAAVVQDEAGAVHYHSAAETSVNAVRNADHIAPTIGDRERRRLFAVGAKVSRRGRGALSRLAIVNLMAGENGFARPWIAWRRHARNGPIHLDQFA